MGAIDFLVENNRAKPIAGGIVADGAVERRGHASTGGSNGLVEALASRKLGVGVAEQRLAGVWMAFDGDDEVEVGGAEDGDIEHDTQRTGSGCVPRTSVEVRKQIGRARQWAR